MSWDCWQTTESPTLPSHALIPWGKGGQQASGKIIGGAVSHIKSHRKPFTFLFWEVKEKKKANPKLIEIQGWMEVWQDGGLSYGAAASPSRDLGAPSAMGHTNSQVTAHGNLLVNLALKQESICLSWDGAVLPGPNPSSFTQTSLTEVWLMGAGLAWGRTQICARKPWPHWNHWDKTAIDLAGTVIFIEFKAKKRPLITSTLTFYITQPLEFCLLVCSVEGITFPRRNFFVMFVLSLNCKTKDLGVCSCTQASCVKILSLFSSIV